MKKVAWLSKGSAQAREEKMKLEIRLGSEGQIRCCQSPRVFTVLGIDNRRS